MAFTSLEGSGFDKMDKAGCIEGFLFKNCHEQRKHHAAKQVSAPDGMVDGSSDLRSGIHRETASLCLQPPIS